MNPYLSRTKTLFGFAAPIIGTQLVGILPQVVAMYFVANLGKHELAAGALATSSFITMIATGASFFNAMSILISHRKEKNAMSDVGSLFMHGMGFALILGIILGFLLWHMDKILVLFGQDPGLIALTHGYFHFAAFSIPLMLLLTNISQFYIGMGQPRVAFILSLCNAPLSIFFSYTFVLGHFGAPILGLTGIMCASLITQLIMLSIMLIVFSASKKTKQILQHMSDHTVNIALCKKIIGLGLPISVQVGSELVAIAIITYFMGWFGTDALAATQIVNQYVLLAIMLYIGFSSAISIVTSRAYANNDVALIREYSLTGIALMSIFFVVIALVFIFFPIPLIDLFLDNTHVHHKEIVTLGKAFFIIAIFTNYADSIRYITAGAYRGLQDSKKPMFVGMFCLWLISISSSYLLGIKLHVGPIGVRLGIGIGIICATLYLLFDFYRHKLPRIARRRCA